MLTVCHHAQPLSPMRKVRSVVPDLDPLHQRNSHINVERTHGQYRFEQNPQLRGRNNWYCFLQSDLEVPEKVMTKRAGQYLVVPVWKFTHLILVHAKFDFDFFETLLNRPAQAAQPHQFGQKLFK